MSNQNRNELAADLNNGTYVCENPSDAEILFDMDFYERLGDDWKGTIYGNVSDEIAEMIENEYGIH